MTAEIIGIIAAATLAFLILGSMILPFAAALNHVTYEVNTTLITGSIAALSGIISAVAMKKLQNPSSTPEDAEKPH
jgi:hypothetical protein